MRCLSRVTPSVHGSEATPRRRIASSSATRTASSDGSAIGRLAQHDRAESLDAPRDDGARRVVEFDGLVGHDLIGEQSPHVVLVDFGGEKDLRLRFAIVELRGDDERRRREPVGFTQLRAAPVAKDEPGARSRATTRDAVGIGERK